MENNKILEKEIQRKESVIVKLQDKYKALERKHSVHTMQKVLWFIAGILVVPIFKLLF